MIQIKQNKLILDNIQKLIQEAIKRNKYAEYAQEDKKEIIL